MRTLNVELGDRAYPIYIGEQLLEQTELYRRHIPQGTKVLIVTNETVAPLYLAAVAKALNGFDCMTLQLPDGEKYKSLDSLNRIYSMLLENNFDRQCTLIALGGGVIGDITGFAAASYQRGVNFIQVPTTLLAQVDSSVGGKTAINHPLGKNMIGAFYQPKCVISDTLTLNTLPPRELSAGLAEIIKYGLIRDSEFFDWLENHVSPILQLDSNSLSDAIERSCRNKADIVIADEREQGVRALLNLGHTFGHAIETFLAYEKWLHGEAVAVGTRMASEFSEICGWISREELQRINTLLTSAALPDKPPPGMQADDFMRLMAKDKKVQNDQIRLVLLKKIGHAEVCNDYDRDLLYRYLSRITASH